MTPLTTVTAHSLPVWVQLALCLGAIFGIVCDVVLILLHLWLLWKGA